MTKLVVKLGGSTVTKKKETKNFPRDMHQIICSGYEFINWGSLDKISLAIAGAIRESNAFDTALSLVLVNGAGPFGHYLVWDRINGNKEITPNLVHQSVEHLNYEVSACLAESGIKTVSIHPFNTCSFNGREYDIVGLWTLANAYLCDGNIPITYGDLVPTVGCKSEPFGSHKVISGDDLATKIAKEWHADKIIMVTDIPGLYNKDPDEDPNAKLISRIAVRQVDGIAKDFQNELERYGIEFSAKGIDVTKGFFGKTFKLYKSTYETGIKSQVCDVNSLEAALKGKDVGTVYVKT